MPATFDAAAYAPGSGAAALTFSHTTSGTNRGLVVFVGSYEDGSDDTRVTGITYNGVALTLGLKNFQGTSGFDCLEVWYLNAEPASGAHDVVVTVHSSVNSFCACAVSANDCNQSTRFGTFAENESLGSSIPSVVISAATDDLCVAGLHYYENAGTYTVTSNNDTAIALAGGGNWDKNDAGDDIGFAGNRAAGAASVTLDFTMSGSCEWIMVGVAFKAAAAAGRTTKNTRSNPLGIRAGMPRRTII